MKTKCNLSGRLLLIMLPFLLFSCKNSPVDLKKEIEAANKKYIEVVKSGDIDKIVQEYTSDAKVFMPYMEVVEGRKSIRLIWENMLKEGTFNIKIKTIDTTPVGDFVIEDGEYTMLTPDENIIDKGKYLVVWKKENGIWKLYRDIFNSNLPLPVSEDTN